MDWTFEDFKTKLDGLQPSVRKKALKIAQELVKENGYSREKAITENQKGERVLLVGFCGNVPCGADNCLFRCHSIWFLPAFQLNN